MSQTRDEIVREILNSLRRISRAMVLDSKRMMREHDLSAPQMLVLRLLTIGEQSSVQLARALFVSPSNMTGIIDRLEKKGLILRKKKPGDRRITLICLTEKGERISREVPDMTEARLIAGLVDMGESEVLQIHEAATRLVDLLGGPGPVTELEPVNGFWNGNSMDGSSGKTI